MNCPHCGSTEHNIHTKRNVLLIGFVVLGLVVAFPGLFLNPYYFVFGSLIMIGGFVITLFTPITYRCDHCQSYFTEEEHLEDW